jgi:hypothetical protein
MTRAAVFLLAALPGIAATAVINARLYGSPLRSGYGSLDILFAVANISANFRHWLAWLTDTETWFIFLGLIPLVLPVRSWWQTKDNRSLLLLGPFALAIVALYAAYEPFDAWWFLRFLLPAFPPLMVGAGILAIRIAGDRAWRAAAVSLAVGLFVLHIAHHDVVLTGDPKTLEGRYFNVAKFVEAKTPPNALFISMQHSGSLRYYTHRLTLRYDYLNENRVPDALAWCRDHGYHPYVVLEDWELPVFKKRFPNWSNELEASLVFGYGGAQQVFVYDPAARNVQFEKIPAAPIPLVPRPFPQR